MAVSIKRERERERESKNRAKYGRLAIFSITILLFLVFLTGASIAHARINGKHIITAGHIATLTIPKTVI
jgi:hypothetical protein